MARTSSKPSMKNALQGSLQGEEQSFAARFAKADEKFGNTKLTAPEVTTVGEIAPPAAIAPAPITKVVREAFTIPEPEHKQIDALRGRLLSQATASTKSEVVRAGLLLLSELSDQDLVDIMGRLERVKTGRPKAA